MTPEQLRIRDAIRDHIESNGFPPSYRDLAQLLGRASVGTLHTAVQRMVASGALHSDLMGRHNSLRLPDMPDITVVPTRVLRADLERRVHG